jgi:hypothetical protein
MTPHHTPVTTDTSPRLLARLVWAEGSWRCLLSPRGVMLYSGGKRLLTHAVREAEEGVAIADIWLRSIRRMGELANGTALVSKR